MRPACVRWRAPWLRWVGCEQVGQSPHGRDGHAPFFCAAKSNFKVTMVLVVWNSKNIFCFIYPAYNHEYLRASYPESRKRAKKSD